MWKGALERVGQTTKRKDKEEGTETGPSKKKSGKSFYRDTAKGKGIGDEKERARKHVTKGEREE